MIVAVEFYVEVMRELVIAIGAALFLANVFALVRRRNDRRKAEIKRAQRQRAKNAGVRVKEPEVDLAQAPVARTVLFAIIGFVVMLWGLASLVVSG